MYVHPWDRQDPESSALSELPPTPFQHRRVPVQKQSISKRKQIKDQGLNYKICQSKRWHY